MLTSEPRFRKQLALAVSNRQQFLDAILRNAHISISSTLRANRVPERTAHYTSARTGRSVANRRKKSMTDIICDLVLIMGFVGYIVKLIHIPVNNILVGGA